MHIGSLKQAEIPLPTISIDLNSTLGQENRFPKACYFLQACLKRHSDPPAVIRLTMVRARTASLKTVGLKTLPKNECSSRRHRAELSIWRG